MEYLQYTTGDSPNLGYLFNRKLPGFLVEDRSYRGASYEFIQLLERLTLDNYRRYYASLERDFADFGQGTLSTLALDVRYPGLLAGLGYSHSTGNSDDEMKLGFSFDYSTGLPVLPGSSIKGLLRSFFPGRYGDSSKTEADRRQSEVKKKEVLDYLKDIFDELNLLKEVKEEAFEQKINEVENLIFEGKFKLEGQEKFQYVNPLEHDVFFDAFPKVEANVRKKFLAIESITPHKDPLSNPLPLRLLKIAPGVTMQFTFLLNDHGLNRKDKERLFRLLLLRHGAGAKTRTGFGQFMDPDALQRLQKDPGNGYLNNFAPGTGAKTTASGGTSTPLQTPVVPVVDRSIRTLKEAKKGKTVKAIVKSNVGGVLQLQLQIDDYNKGTMLKYFKSGEMEIGKEILVDIADIQGKGDKATLIVNNPRKIG